MKYFLSFLSVFVFNNAFSQIGITAIPACNVYTLTATVTGSIPTASGITEDDTWSGVIPIGFSYKFYGVPNTQCIIGANGTLGFELSYASSFNTWSIPGTLLSSPSSAPDIVNCICGPWCDIYVPAGGTINYSTQGVAPFRSFAVTYCHDAMFSCTTEWITTQIIIYETTGIAEVHIGHRTICLTGWNGSHAIVGVINAAGTDAVTAPGRDYPAVWAATDEAWRFTPDSLATGWTYTVTSIPYAPVPYAASTLYWYDSSTHAYLGSGPSVVVTPTVTTTYEVAALGCSTTDTAASYKTVGPAVFYCFNASNNGPVCTGDSLILHGNGDSTGATYFWYGPGGYTATTQYVSRYPVTAADSGVYFAVRSIDGLHDTVNTDVVIKPLPAVMASSSSPVCSGTGNTLSLTASLFAAGETFAWSGPNGFSSAVENPSITAPIVGDEGLYKVATLYNGCKDSGFVAVFIDSTPAIPAVSSNSPVCSAPRGVLQLFSGDATPGVSYGWVGANGFTSALQNPSFSPVYLPDAGIYTVTASIPYDGLICSSQNTTTVVVDSTPFLPVMTSDAPICSGNTLTLTAASSDLSIYKWEGPNLFSSGLQNPTIPLVTTPATGVYSVTATYFYPGVPLGCISDTATLIVVVDSTPAFPTASSNSPGPPDTSICQGDTLKLTSGDATAGVSFSWSGAAGFSSTDENPGYIIGVMPSATGLYTVTATLGMCSSSTIITVSITPTPAITATSNSPVCSGNADTLFLQVISNPGTTFIWTGPYVFSSVAQSVYRTPVKTEYAGVYQVTSYLNGCASLPFNDTVNIRETPAPPVVPWLTYCQNFAAPPLQAYGDSIEWYPTSAANAAGTYIAPVPPTASDTVMWFYMTQTVATCMSGLDSMKITVNPQPSVTVSPDVSLCPHDSAILTAVDTDPIAYYHWFPSLYLSDTSGPVVISRAENDMHYTVVASNQYGCTDTAHVTVTVFSGAVLYLGDSVTLYPGQTYQLNPQTNCTSFAWFPPSGLSDAHISNPIASPEMSTKYIVQGETSWGCKAEDSINIYVNDETLLAMPNAFSPGSGSPNSEFKIIVQGIATLQYFRIFDRWGVMVFETTDINAGWDGNYKGTPQPLGVYVYEISALTSAGREFEKHGNLTLIR